MEFKNYLEKTAKEIDREIEKILKGWRDEVKNISPKLVPLLDLFIKSCQGGKRIRGVLVKLGYELIRSKEKKILKVAAAYEIFHAAILAHDDIIDQSPTRRDQPSLYKQFSAMAEKSFASSALKALGGDHYGISQAICLADAGFFLAIKIIAESKFEEQFKNQAVSLFSKTMVDTAIGQMLDISHGERELVAKYKTARYTIAGPLKIGAVLAGANGKLVKLLDNFGENLGIAFQIRDDILDGEVESVDEANVKALEYVMKAKKVIPGVTNDPNLGKLLEQMCEYLVERNK